MSALVNTTYLFVSSENAMQVTNNGNSDIKIDIPEDSIRCKADEYICLSLIQHSMICDIFNVTTNNNTIVADGVSIVLPRGSYKVTDLEKIQILGLTIAFDPIAHGFVFTNSLVTTRTLIFQGDLRYLFGVSSTITIPANGTFRSTQPIIARLVNDLCISFSNISMGPPQNISNLQKAGTDITPIVGIVPLRAAPGTLNVYYNYNGSFVTQIYETDLQTVNIQTKDIFGRFISDLPRWNAVFRVDIYRRIGEDPVTKALNQILRLVRMAFLSVTIGTDRLE